MFKVLRKRIREYEGRNMCKEGENSIYKPSKVNNRACKQLTSGWIASNQKS